PRSFPSLPKFVQSLSHSIFSSSGSLKWETTPETNTERMFQINFLSNAILSIRLLPLLRATAQTPGIQPHPTTVGSRALTGYTFNKYPVPETTSLSAFLNDPARFHMIRYPDSKLLVSLWVHALAKGIDSSVIILNSCRPGMVEADMSHQPGLVRNIFYTFY
ncbi:hypothetical protein DFH08DRAFT_454614, partial [Mycena albidolilacea]